MPDNLSPMPIDVVAYAELRTNRPLGRPAHPVNHPIDLVNTVRVRETKNGKRTRLRVTEHFSSFAAEKIECRDLDTRALRLVKVETLMNYYAYDDAETQAQAAIEQEDREREDRMSRELLRRLGGGEIDENDPFAFSRSLFENLPA